MRFLPHRTVLFLSLMLPLLFAALGCDKGDAKGGGDESTSREGDGAETTEEAVPVEVAVLKKGPIEALIRSSANLEAEGQVGIFAEAARRVVAIQVEEGDRVERGQTLLRLQDEEQRSSLAGAQAQFDKAEREFERQTRLHEQQLTTDKAMNDATFDYEQQKIAVADAERQLGYTRVRAAIAGTVTKRLVHVGDQVQVGQQLFEIVDFESLVARVYVPEKNLGQLVAGQPTRIFARALSDRAHLGTVDRISPIVDPMSGTVKVTVNVGDQPGLRPGLFVDVEVITAVNEDAVLVPKRALVYDDDQVYLFRLSAKGDTVDRVNVIPRLANRDFVEPMGGLVAGDRVVIAGQAGLKDGAPVKVVDPDAPKAEESVTAEASTR